MSTSFVRVLVTHFWNSETPISSQYAKEGFIHTRILLWKFLSSEHSMGTCTWHSLTYRMRSTMGSCFVRHVGASCNSLQKRHAEYQLGCLLPCLCMPSRKQRVLHCCDEDAPGSLSIGVSAQLRVYVAADRCWFKSSVMRFT